MLSQAEPQQAAMISGHGAKRPTTTWRRPARLAAIACGVLVVGLLVYLTDRSGVGAALIPRVDALAGHRVFGTLAQWLPSFLHPLAFSLFTAAALPARAAPRYGVCVAWGVVNLAFEFGQHAAIKEPLAAALDETFGRTPPVRWLADYFLHGTFDGGDVVAAVLGAAAAAAVLAFVQPRQEQPHAP